MRTWDSTQRPRDWKWSSINKNCIQQLPHTVNSLNLDLSQTFENLELCRRTRHNLDLSHWTSEKTELSWRTIYDSDLSGRKTLHELVYKDLRLWPVSKKLQHDLDASQWTWDSICLVKVATLIGLVPMDMTLALFRIGCIMTWTCLNGLETYFVSDKLQHDLDASKWTWLSPCLKLVAAWFRWVSVDLRLDLSSDKLQHDLDVSQWTLNVPCLG